MQFATATLFLFAAMGALAIPAESNPNGVDVRDDANILIKYDGTCDKEKNECKYKSQGGGTAFVKCPTFANKRCTKDGNKCTYDSVDKSVTCD
ncbi:hypothetical protein NUW58_g1805 [Xylaria curta]|uniref:Uncharacterized protein n=1 Tax=Xylaria curta TaxID=42375 RepID=A0ACC1PKB6_9PEZI|nr:hypothetical protein NUW58_g1805 [Xylaria curta]